MEAFFGVLAGYLMGSLLNPLILIGMAIALFLGWMLTWPFLVAICLIGGAARLALFHAQAEAMNMHGAAPMAPIAGMAAAILFLLAGALGKGIRRYLR